MRILKKVTFLLVTVTLLCGSIPIAYAQDDPNLDERILLPLVTTGGPGDTGATPNLETLALQDVAARTGVPVADLQIVASAAATYSLTGATAVNFKIESTVDGADYSVTLTPTGAVVDAEELASAEAAANYAQYGRVDPDLAAFLASNPAEQAVNVIVWVDTPTYEPPERVAPDLAETEAASVEEQVDAQLAVADAQWMAFVSSATAATASQLASMGLSVDADPFVPVVRTVMSPAQIQEVASWQDVERIYLSEMVDSYAVDAPDAPELEYARSSTYVHTVQARNILGFGVKLGQVEVGGRVSTSNPYLDLYDADRLVNNNANVCPTNSTHSTGVAGIMLSFHPSRFGIAPGARLYAAGSGIASTCATGNVRGNTGQLQSAATAAVAWGAQAINNSWGSVPSVNRPTSNDKFFDSIVINNFRSIVVAAGNDGNTTGRVGSPALGYNMISVGNFNDHNTTSWSGDTMNSSSSYVDPLSTHGDRDKPEIAAPGTAINSTTTVSPWTGNIGSGTSYAAPVITGAIGLLLQRNPTLRSWPEAVKAILMATAIHNIEGSARLSERDGAGALYMPYADDVARRVNGNWGAQGYSCSTVSPLEKSISLVAGKRTRVVIVWDQNPSYSSYDSQPSADLDLRIKNSAGTTVASSLKFDNTFEIVDFTPSSSGTYRISITRPRCSLTPRYLGWAWWRNP